MEYLENGDLQRYLTRPLPELEARTITLQVLEGLKFMHENGYVHRDLKPGVSVPRFSINNLLTNQPTSEYHGCHNRSRVVRKDCRLRNQ